MIKIFRLLFFICVSFTPIFSQSLYFKTGKNFTNYIFETSTSGIQSSTVRLQSDSGSFFELGAALPFKNTRFSYEFGVSLNELNSLVVSPSKAVRYKTEYVGLDNSVSFSVINAKRVLIDAKLGFGLQTIVFGRQEIGGVIYDLKGFSEFNGLFFRQSLGTQIKLVASNQLNFCIGYDFHYDVFNTKNNTNQSLLINNNQIKFGIYYKLEDKNIQKQINQFNRTDQLEGSSIINNSDIYSKKIESDKKAINSNKNTTTEQYSVPRIGVNLLNTKSETIQSDNKPSKIIKNAIVTQPSVTTNNTLKLIPEDVRPNKVRENENVSSPIVENKLKSTDVGLNQIDNKVTQSNLILKQPSINSSNIILPDSKVSSTSRVSNLTTSNKSSVNIAVGTTIAKSLLKSNSKIGSPIQTKSINEVNNKILKSKTSSGNESNPINNTSEVDMLTLILNRLNLIETKLNILERRKYENK